MKLRNLLNESPDKIILDNVEINYFDNGVCTFFIYRDEITESDEIAAIGYNTFGEKYYFSNSKLETFLKNIIDDKSTKFVDIIDRIKSFSSGPSHHDLKHILISLNLNYDKNKPYDLSVTDRFLRTSGIPIKISGRIFLDEKNNKFYLSIWEHDEQKLLKKYKDKITKLLEKLNINGEKLLCEIKSKRNSFISYLDLIEKDSLSMSDNFERQKIDDLKIAHEKKALLNKELKDFLDKTPKTNIELYRALEKKFGVPIVKLRQLKNKPLDVLLKKKVKELIQEIYSEDTKLPFLENRISEDEYIRTFDKNTNENELKWHIDGEDRIVESLHKTDWMIQLDNNIPQRFEGKIKIKEGVYHRLIKGTNDLQLKIKKL